ncbi:MAG: phosphoglycerate kinase [Candidatus Lokiarchaeota archaeon]|nr:phosphoglycerate kinase [Candidatus Lokiarchaeota archaeon]
MFDYVSYKDVELKEKKILIRPDINSNIDIENNSIRESPRIQSFGKALEEFKECAVVVMAHQSRPGKNDFTSLKLHAEELKKYTNMSVKFVDDIFGDKAVQAINDLKTGEVLILENVRMWDKENKTYSDFSEAENLEMIQTLAPLFDYVIADAFGAAHRAQPSVIGWPKMIAGPTIQKEFEYMTKLLENPEKPIAMLIGGAKAIDKFNAMKFNFENERLDYALCAGLTAILIMEAIGINTGVPNKKAIEKDLIKAKNDIIATYQKYKDKIILPKDLTIDDNGIRKNIEINELEKYNDVTGDIGETTTKEFTNIINKCKTIVANGPPGIFEKEIFRKGTRDMTIAMANSTKENNALTIIGGGEFGTAAEMLGIANKISFISTGGGAMLEILSGKDVPLVKALREKKP